jgi:hypothetical protein
MDFDEIERDDLAISVARAVAIANISAVTQGVDPGQSLVTIIEQSGEFGATWRIEYGRRNFIGHRGGDVVILVDK